ncbi:MAG: thermonuclease family protein [Dehalococcoidia bacterium]
MPRKPPDFDNHPASYSAVTAAGLTRGVCYHVVDGDTADFLIDLGWYHYSYHALRFEGINTAELRGTRGAERDRAIAAHQRVQALLLGRPVLIQAHKQAETFGRFVAHIWCEVPAAPPGLAGAIRLSPNGASWTSINELLVHEGLADRTA